jgi:hypothetical protein
MSRNSSSIDGIDFVHLEIPFPRKGSLRYQRACLLTQFAGSLNHSETLILGPDHRMQLLSLDSSL